MKRILFFIVAGFCMSATNFSVAAGEPTGAFKAWTSDDPRVAEIRALISNGELTEAEKKFVGQDASEDVELRELIERVRREYNVDEDCLLKKLKPSIPDVTAADIRRWREAGEVQYRVIDRQVKYFRREPSNLFRFCEDAKSRRVLVAEDSDAAKFKLADHLTKVIAEAEKTGKTEVVPVKHRIIFSLTIPPGAGGAKAGSVARVWLPFPQEYRQQKNVKLLSSEPAPKQIADNGVPHRSLYYELVIDDPAKPIEIKTVYGYTSYAYYPILNDADAKPLPANWDGAQYLAERPPHIAFTPELKAKVNEIVDDEINPLIRARKIFRWVSQNVAYCAEEEYGLIPSISTKALTSLKGDCGVQGMLFITMCRAAGVPARWQSGWETKPVEWNMHDWVEFYVAPWGWLPADPSYGLQNSDDPKIHEFYFGHQDSYRLIVNLDYGRAFVPAKQSLRSEPVDFQQGEVEIDRKNVYYLGGWEHEFSFEQAGG